MMKAIAHADGHVFISGPSGEQLRADTKQCCHCGRHWIVLKGSGILRGYCQGCDHSTCGAAECDPCIPQEARLENIEAGKPELTERAAKILVPALPAG